MQKKTLFVAAVLAISSSIISCDSTDSKTFSNKNDSVAFARAVLDQYPEASSGRLVSDTTGFPLPGPGDGFSPISWETVEDYSKRYDADPCLKSPTGVFYQGFSIDTAGYTRLMRTPSIKGLFMRLGKKPDGGYTIMILGTDAEGKIINTASVAGAPKDSTNFDQIPPCPAQCP